MKLLYFIQRNQTSLCEQPWLKLNSCLDMASSQPSMTAPTLNDVLLKPTKIFI
ncbi:hypothetical protein Lalb_Chr19g0128131 [Lupinus albus]|uniref:Uncharacterized protein n=1 Tax=Lupinus albus TaxID=3870 RepID=A0A6A4NWW3_LUPAL|nr:hypothetical protein Lalb_Chr19g0128131 [Lupinus albus]